MADYEVTYPKLVKLRRSKFLTRASRVRALCEALDSARKDRDYALVQMANASNIASICGQDSKAMRAAIDQVIDTRAYWRSCATQLATSLEKLSQTAWPSEEAVKAAEDALRTYEALAAVAPKAKL